MPDRALPRLRRAEWRVDPCPHSDAAALCRDYHYARGAPNTGQTHGLYPVDGWPLVAAVGAALWLPPTRRAAEHIAPDNPGGVLALSRLVVIPDAPRNAATFLLAASMRLLDRDRWPTLVTYADTRLGHTGAIYRATGWTEEGPTAAGDTWVHHTTGEQRGRKRGAVNLTAAQLADAGYVRAPAAPKLRFTHRLARGVTTRH